MRVYESAYVEIKTNYLKMTYTQIYPIISYPVEEIVDWRDYRLEIKVVNMNMNMMIFNSSLYYLIIRLDQIIYCY